MSAILAPRAAPPSSPRIWTDSKSLYLEFPGHPDSYIISFPRNSLGFSKAYHLIATKTESAGEVQLSPSPKPIPPQQSAAEAILRRNGVI